MNFYRALKIAVMGGFLALFGGGAVSLAKPSGRERLPKAILLIPGDPIFSTFTHVCRRFSYSIPFVGPDERPDYGPIYPGPHHTMVRCGADENIAEFCSHAVERGEDYDPDLCGPDFVSRTGGVRIFPQLPAADIQCDGVLFRNPEVIRGRATHTVYECLPFPEMTASR